MIATIEPRKRPLQARSNATVDAVLQATAQILESDGLSALNTNAVARRAGVSIGTLYQYFPTKEAILAEIIRRKRRSLYAGLTTALQQAGGEPFETSVRRLVDITIDHQADKPGFARALDYAYAALPLQKETDALKHDIIAIISDFLADFDVPEPQQAAVDVVAITRGMVEAAGLRGERDRKALAERICKAVMGYIRPV